MGGWVGRQEGRQTDRHINNLYVNFFATKPLTEELPTFRVVSIVCDIIISSYNKYTITL
jgi:hypothetical protein